MADAGETVYRQWWATRDQRTRPAHRVAHEQTVPYGTPFRVGGADMRFPGDPAGPAYQVINCRCVMLILTGSEGQIGRASCRERRELTVVHSWFTSLIELA